METAEPILNQEISYRDLANDKKQKKIASSYLKETNWRPEFDNGSSTSKPAMFKKVPEIDRLASILETTVRKVVAEVVDHKLKQYVCFTNNPSPQVLPLTDQAVETPRFKLVFSKNLSLPMFTQKQVLDRDNNPLQIFLVDLNCSSGSDQITPILLNPAPKVELVVLNGDFPPRDYDSWTSQQFDNNIVKARTGKPPLIFGDIRVTLSDGVATIGDIKFTDNSSWIPSRKFKIGARVVLPRGHTNSFHGCVLEAMTEPFIVREKRMESYRKDQPLKLDDEVWMLKKIRKNGVFHLRLASKDIFTVKDILNLSTTTTDQKKLRRILGSTMSDKMWEAVLKHAKTCKIDNYNIPHEQSSVDMVQGIVTENALPAQGAGNAMMEYQPNLGHINVLQVNEHLINDVDAEGSMSSYFDEFWAPRL